MKEVEQFCKTLENTISSYHREKMDEVNKLLGKPEFSEQDSIAFYKRLGARGKSPVITHKDFEEVDYRSVAKGIGIGVGGSALIATILYLTYQQ